MTDYTDPCACNRCTRLRGSADVTKLGLFNPELARMFLCPLCGNKRCPHASDHRNDCTGSNEPGQKGSGYEWNPMETAPKDGRPVDLQNAGGSIVIQRCRWGLYDDGSIGGRMGWTMMPTGFKPDRWRLSDLPVKPPARTHLIWSVKWGRWHRRSSTGGANGYTDDILQAGIFETKTAMAYHDEDGPDARDKAIPLADARERLQKRADEVAGQLEEARARLAEFNAAAKAL